MKEVLALIEQIIEEHKVFIQQIKGLEQAANDASVIVHLEKVKKEFVPGRLGQKEELKNLSESLGIIDKGIRTHFHREETRLVDAAEKYGGKELASALRSLLVQHNDLINRLDNTAKHLADLTGGGLSHFVWEASAHDMQAYIAHTRQLLEVHASNEQGILYRLRDVLLQESKGK